MSFLVCRLDSHPPYMIGALSPLTLKVIIDRCILLAVLLLVFQLFLYFCFVLLLVSSLVN